MVGDVRRWRKGIVEKVVPVLGSLLGCGVRTLRRVVVKVRRNRHYAGLGDALRFSEQRNEDDRRYNRGLRGDGNDQRAAADAALAGTLFRATFDETALKRTKIILRMRLGFDSHHTPPQKSSAS